MIEATTRTPQATPKRGPVAAALGVLSVALLAASLLWAHHWGPLADAIVAAWAAATLGSLAVSIHFLRDDNLWSTRLAKRLVKVGLAGGLVSIGALILAGAVWAAGVDPTGACGGG